MSKAAAPAGKGGKFKGEKEFGPLVIKAMEAKPAPPVGPVLAQNGVNPGEFCKQFNEKTKGYEPGTPLPVMVKVKADKSFTFIIKLPPTSYLINKEAGYEKGAQKPGRDEVRMLSRAAVNKVAEIKAPEMTSGDIAAAVKTVEGTARSMGYQIKEDA